MGPNIPLDGKGVGAGSSVFASDPENLKAVMRQIIDR
jgi:hypothetical protein